ncbi:hypothetical protein HanRHA438_Chr17g0797001 [Helianthus annuus]|nr:hypothetical protein HanRHA438_Chr17g0797001 [Helianthus annuus]
MHIWQNRETKMEIFFALIRYEEIKNLGYVVRGRWWSSGGTDGVGGYPVVEMACGGGYRRSSALYTYYSSEFQFH